MKNGDAITLEQAIALTRDLSCADKSRLICALRDQLEAQASPIVQSTPLHFGLLPYLRGQVTEEDIAEIRREMWSNFPREDIVP